MIDTQPLLTIAVGQLASSPLSTMTIHAVAGGAIGNYIAMRIKK